MQTITINVTNKVATAEGNPFIVCGNSDYIIKFVFDAAWKGQGTKTARFTYEQDGEEVFSEVVFSGDSCNAPVIHNAKKVFVGVYAGDILSTTRCGINCKASILDGEGVEHEEPSEDIYNQIVKIANDAVAAANEATEAAAEFEATTRETFANAIKGNVYGAAVRADDVSPAEHNLACKVENKNLIPYPYTETTLTRDGLTFTSLGDGTVSVKGTVTADFATFSMVDHIELVDGVTYFVGDSPHLYIAYKDPTQTMKYVYNAPFMWSKNYTFFKLFLQYTKGEVVDEIIKPMLSVGNKATEYTPYIDPSTVTVTRCGKNLWDLGDVEFEKNNTFVLSNSLPANKTYILTADITSTDTDNTTCLIMVKYNSGYVALGEITRGVKQSMVFTPKELVKGFSLYASDTATNSEGDTAIFKNIQLEIGNTATDYEVYNGTTYTPNADGTVEGITSLSPSMTLLTDTLNTVINCEYNRDTNKALAGNVVTADGTVVSQNADFAEVAEWWDGNPDNEDRTGYFVCADVPVHGIVMRKATSVDDVKGVSILAPAFAGNYSKDKLDGNGKLLPKYSYVAIIGFVPVIDNGTCEVGGRCMPDNNGCAIPSSNSMGYQVVNRIDENRVLIIIEPNGDMVQRIKTKINDMQKNIGDISVALDELHAYAQALISGGATE